MDFDTIITICLLAVIFSIYQLQRQINILRILIADLFQYIKEQKAEKG